MEQTCYWIVLHEFHSSDYATRLDRKETLKMIMCHTCRKLRCKFRAGKFQRSDLHFGKNGVILHLIEKFLQFCALRCQFEFIRSAIFLKTSQREHDLPT